VMQRFPELKEWVVYNKTVPKEILYELCIDSDPKLRVAIAMKRKIDNYIFNLLRNDKDESVRVALLNNTKLSLDQKRKINPNGSDWYKTQFTEKTSQ
ncbi:MAG: hypothetical protein AAGK97_07740, partial [Bacteroidota bacterium]